MSELIIITYNDDNGLKTICHQGRIVYEGRNEFAAEGALCNLFAIYMEKMDESVITFYGPKAVRKALSIISSSKDRIPLSED